MRRSLTLALAATLTLTVSPGRAGEQKPQGDKKVQGIKAEVRGTLHFESGRGYFISITVRPYDKAEEENRVWLWCSEDKVLVRQLQGLSGKEVIAKGELAQMPSRGRTASAPPLGTYMSHFEIGGAGAR